MVATSANTRPLRPLNRNMGQYLSKNRIIGANAAYIRGSRRRIDASIAYHPGYPGASELPGKSRQPGTGGKGLPGVVATSGLAHNPHGNRLERRRQPQRESRPGFKSRWFVAVVDG